LASLQGVSHFRRFPSLGQKRGKHSPKTRKSRKKAQEMARRLRGQKNREFSYRLILRKFIDERLRLNTGPGHVHLSDFAQPNANHCGKKNMIVERKTKIIGVRSPPWKAVPEDLR